MAGQGWAHKRQREEEFPLKLIWNAFDLDVRTAQASWPMDKVHILNSICEVGADHLDDEPDMANPQLDRVNNELRAAFAQAALPLAVERADRSDWVSIARPLALIASDVNRKHLRLELPWYHWNSYLCENSLCEIGLTLTTLTKLQYLHVDLRESDLRSNPDTDDVLAALGAGLRCLECLEDLSILLNGCSTASDYTSGAIQLGSRVEVLFEGEWYAGEVVDFDSEAGFWNVQCDADEEGIITTSDHVRREGIEEAAASADEYSNLGDLCAGLGKLSKLRRLWMDLSKWKSLADVSTLSSALRGIHSLDQVRLDFSQCDKLEQNGAPCITMMGLWEVIKRKQLVSFTIANGKQWERPIVDPDGKPLPPHLMQVATTFEDWPFAHVGEIVSREWGPEEPSWLYNVHYCAEDVHEAINLQMKWDQLQHHWSSMN